MEIIFKKFDELLAQLQTNPDVHIVKYSGKGVPIIEKLETMLLKRMKGKLGYVLSDDLLAYKDVSNALQLYWTYDLKGESGGAGEFKLNSLFEVFLYDKPTLWTEDMTTDEIKLLKQFAAFDDHPLGGNGQLTGFITDGNMPPPIYFYDRGQTFKLTITYQEYISEMLELAAISNWQYLFCELNDHQFKTHIYGKVASKLDDLKKLFPDKNLEKYYSIIQ